MARLVSEVTWTMERWKRCGMSSKPGSVCLSGGRTRTAVGGEESREVSSVVARVPGSARGMARDGSGKTETVDSQGATTYRL